MLTTTQFAVLLALLAIIALSIGIIDAIENEDSEPKTMAEAIVVSLCFFAMVPFIVMEPFYHVYLHNKQRFQNKNKDKNNNE